MPPFRYHSQLCISKFVRFSYVSNSIWIFLRNETVLIQYEMINEIIIIDRKLSFREFHKHSQKIYENSGVGIVAANNTKLNYSPGYNFVVLPLTWIIYCIIPTFHGMAECDAVNTEQLVHNYWSELQSISCAPEWEWGRPRIFFYTRVNHTTYFVRRRLRSKCFAWN